ncbi:hypothetical protein AB0K43_02145 [Kitasatospora sp. NPDC049258]|uniref:hypothetical protein n=1 Tax=Kitasatospora sp. NPDC049258 TaxID=3155394 RepID=UPI00342B9E81
MQVDVGEGDAPPVGRPVGAAVVGAGAALLGASLGLAAGGVLAAGPEEEALGLALRLGLGAAEEAGAVLAEAGVRLGMVCTGCSSVGALPGRAVPVSCGAASATTPAPPITSPAAVTRTSRRPRPVRRRARPAGRGSTAGPAAGCGTAALAGAPQPGQEYAPFRCRRHGTQ